LPRAKGWSQRSKLIVACGAVAGVVVIGTIVWATNPLRPKWGHLLLHTVARGRLELTIMERGALESSANSDIYCRVKAGNKGSTVATQIKNLIDDGSAVKKGDLLVELDDSGLQEQLKTQKITVDKAESDKIQAEEAYNITVSQNKSDIKTAETKVELAIIDLMKYTGRERAEILNPKALDELKKELQVVTANNKRNAREVAEVDLKKYQTGDYLAALKDILGQIENAQSDLSQQEDREAWAYRMMKKGYQTASQAQAETSRKDSFQLTLNKVSLQLDVLVKYTKISQLTGYITALEEANRNLERTQIQAESKLKRDGTDRSAKKSIWEQEVARYKDIEEEIKKCKIYAPQDGMVVYFVPEQVRGGGGSQQSIVAQGEPVREGQKLMQIPDLNKMLVNTKVHEALVSRVHKGLPAQVRIESFPHKPLRGTVDSVATVAAAQDWLSADVKVYTTKVAIDSSDISGIELKPGMSAAVTISIGDALDNVLTVPIQAIIGGPELGESRKVLVMTPDGPVERDITIGGSNQTLAEIKDGVKEGEQVVLNPKAVLGDKIKVRQGGEVTPAAAPTTETGAPVSTPAKPKPSAKARPQGPDFANMTEEQRQKFMEQMKARWEKKLAEYKKATPAERKKMLEAEPEERRDRIKQRLQEAGIALD
jgi:multidrug resistance efflux pump